MQKINRYTCEKCRKYFFTVERVEGTTPFMLLCRNPVCQGRAISAFYKCPQDVDADYEWYIPNKEQIRRLHLATLDHVQRGGLLLHKIDKDWDKYGESVTDLCVVCNAAVCRKERYGKPVCQTHYKIPWGLLGRLRLKEIVSGPLRELGFHWVIIDTQTEENDAVFQRVEDANIFLLNWHLLNNGG